MNSMETRSTDRLPSIRSNGRSSQYPSPTSSRHSPIPSRRLRTNVGSTNKQRQTMLSSSMSTPILSKRSSNNTARDDRPRRPNTSEGGLMSSKSKDSRESDRPASMNSVYSKNLNGQDKARGSDKKSREMAVWTKSLVPTEEIWATETNAKVGKGKLNAQQRLLDSTYVKQKIALEEKQNQMVHKARLQLDRIAREKYGSIRGLFRMFDTDQDGRISMDEFSQGLKARNLELNFPREQQRLVFDHIDSSNDNLVSLKEFIDFFSKGRDFNSSAPMSPTTSVRNDIELEKMRDKIKQKLVNQKRSLKMEDGYSETTSYLINAFRQIDSDQSGYIYYDEFKKALGPQFLNLGIPESDVMKLFNSMDLAGNHRISYYEFSKSLQMNDIDPHFNPFIDQKQRQVKDLQRKANAPWKYPMSTAEMKQKYQEFLGRTGEPEQPPDPPKTPPEMDTVESLQKTSKFDLDKFNRTNHPSPLQMNSKADLSSSQELFADMNETQQLAMGSIVKRITAPPPTDWTRVGYGGNRTSKLSGMHMDSDERFRTSNKEHFAEVIYAPNQPVTRDTISDTEKLANFRKKKFETIRKRQQDHVDRIFAGIEMEETIKKMQTDARIQSKAKSLAKYCEFAYAEDLKNVKKMPLMGMQKKADDSSYKRMWGGSNDSQFNNPNFFKKAEW